MMEVSAVLQWMSEHRTGLLALVGYLLTFGFIPVVLVRKRQPTSAIAWCLAIVLLPYFGTLLFLLIGIPVVNRKLRKKQFHRSRFIRQWIQSTAGKKHHPHPPTDLSRSAEWARMDRLAAVVGAVKMSSGNRAHIYHEGTEAFADKMEAIRQAEHHIHAEYYILRADHTGEEFVEALCRKAREGLEVRLLVDAVGSMRVRGMMRELRRAGGQAQTFLPIMAWRRRFVINLRNHRKILICDGNVGFTGGLNIGDEYLGRTKRFGFWRDTQLRLTGPAVLALQRVFAEDWDFAGGEFLSGAKYFPKPDTSGGDKLQIIWSGPDAEHNAVHSVYFAAICRAQERLWIATPYLIPDQAILNALKAAALHGIDARIITQSSPPDQWIAYFAQRYYWEGLLEAGVRLYQYRKGMMHAKIIIADGAWASVGSANLDIRSMRLNFEINCLIYSRPLVADLERQFEQDLRDSRRIRLRSVLRRPLRLQLAENVCRLMSPIL